MLPSARAATPSADTISSTMIMVGIVLRPACRTEGGILLAMVEKPGVARAVAAARAVALAHSVACEDAVVVAAGSNVLVHLKPAPVIARVMTGTAMLHADL